MTTQPDFTIPDEMRHDIHHLERILADRTCDKSITYLGCPLRFEDGKFRVGNETLEESVSGLLYLPMARIFFEQVADFRQSCAADLETLVLQCSQVAETTASSS